MTEYALIAALLAAAIAMAASGLRDANAEQADKARCAFERAKVCMIDAETAR